jgi:hypothetical protein
MSFSLIAALIVIFILVWAGGSVIYWTLRTGISPMPTSPKVKADLLRLIPPLLSPGKIYELGSGWGTLAFSLAKQYPEKEVIGYEISFIPYVISKLLVRLKKIKNLKIQRRNFLEDPLDEAHLVVCYLYPKGMDRLKIELEKKLKPGTWMISNTFAVPGWQPYYTHRVKDLYHTKIYFYKISIMRNCKTRR